MDIFCLTKFNKFWGINVVNNAVVNALITQT